jgi:hypothetical protein
VLTAWTRNECQKPWQAELGAGRVAYVSRAWTGASESTMRVTPEFAKAEDYLELYSQLQLKGAGSLEATVRGKANNRSLHLIRFGPVDDLADRAVQLNYELPKGFHVASAKVYALGFPEEMAKFTWKESQGHLEAELNRLDNYAVVSVELKK